MTNPMTFPIPQDLSHPELVEWLDGAGFDLATSVVGGGGWLSQVFTVRVQTPDWPSLVGVVVSPNGSWDASAHPGTPTEDELHARSHLPVTFHDGYECDCGECREARAEAAALARAGL